MSTFTDDEIEKLQDILNSIPDYFDDEEEICCPHCGNAQGFTSDDTSLYDGNTYPHKCEDCGKSYELSSSMSFSWSTEKSNA